MKRPTLHKYKTDTLTDKLVPAIIPKEVVSITANVCEQKGVCAICGRGGLYGMPLVYVLHYEDKSINTVCYKCGIKASKREGIKLPLTEPEFYEKMMKGEGV